MTLTPEQLRFPADVGALLRPGVADALSALELGIAYRLLRAAWGEPQPCTLPAEATFLAAVARITTEDLTAAWPRVALALGATQAPQPHGPDGAAAGALLAFEYSRGVHEAMLTEREADAHRRRRQTAAATDVAAHAKRNRQSVTDPLRIRDGTVTDHRAPNARPRAEDSSLLLLPHRSDQSSKSGAQCGARFGAPVGARERKPSGDREGEGEIIGVLGESARAIEALAMWEWERGHSARMLEEAFGKWRQSGHATVPFKKARELARCEHADPARVQFLIEEGNALIAAKGPGCGPVGVVIAGLGEAARTLGRPRDVPIVVVGEWNAKRALRARLIQAQCASQAACARAFKERSNAAGNRAAGGAS